MSLLGLLLLVVLLGFGVYLIETYIPMAPPFGVLLRVIVAVIVIVAVFQFFGLTLGSAMFSPRQPLSR